MRKSLLLLVVAWLCVSCSSAASTTASDSRAIKENPQTFLLSVDELDNITGKSLCYYTNENWINLNLATPAPETESQSSSAQGLVDAAWIYFKRDSSNCDEINTAPADWISFIAAKYETTYEAQLEISENNVVNSNDVDSWMFINDENFKIGDLSVIEYKKSTYPKDSNKIHYAIEFAYYNYVVKIEIEGLENKATLEYIKEIAEQQLYKLQKDVVAIQ